MAYPEGTYPIVFESGVVRFEEDGTLHVHVRHLPGDLHPLQTHPEGEDGFVPEGVTEVVLEGGGAGRVRGSFPRSGDLPEGLVFTIRGYDFVQLEASGDLSILVTGAEGVPDWFTPGKVHRFAREGLAVRLHDASLLPEGIAGSSKRAGPGEGEPKRAGPGEGERSSSDRGGPEIGQRVPESGRGGLGCATLALGLPLLALLAL